MVEHLRSVIRTPILTGLPFGHVPTKVSLPVGVKATLAVQGRDAFLGWAAPHDHDHDHGDAAHDHGDHGDHDHHDHGPVDAGHDHDDAATHDHAPKRGRKPR